MNYQKERALQSQISILQARKKQFKDDRYFTPEETERHHKAIDAEIEKCQKELDTLNPVEPNNAPN